MIAVAADTVAGLVLWAFIVGCLAAATAINLRSKK